jgi:hypothetical protein
MAGCEPSFREQPVSITTVASTTHPVINCVVTVGGEKEGKADSFSCHGCLSYEQ